MPLAGLRSLVILLMLTRFYAGAQDKIYTNSGVTECKIIDITPITVTYLPPRSSKPLTVYVNKVLLLFNDKGAYLQPSKLDFSLKQSQQLVSKFLHAENKPLTSDYIYKSDNSVIYEGISKEDKNFVYIGKNETRIDKKAISAIVYKDGRHVLLGPVAQAASVLWTAYENQTGSNMMVTAAIKETVPKKDSNDQNIIAVKSSAQPEKKVQNAVDQKLTVTEKDTALREKEQQTPAGSSTKEPRLSEEPAQAPVPARKPVIADFLSAPDKEQFEKKATEKTIQFTQFLKIICDKKADYEDWNKAIDQALLLFVNEEARVEVSSLNQAPVQRKIKEYLTHLKLIKYDHIEIRWTNVQYVSQIKKGVDGTYSGTVTFEQEFKGFKDGKLVYSDVTIKKALVFLKTYEKIIDGKAIDLWDVLLGDIGVEATRSL